MSPDSQFDRSTHKSFTKNMVLVVILVSFTPMLLVSGIVLDQFYTSYHEKLFAYLNELVHKHTQNIDGFLNERLNNIRFLAETCDCQQLLDETVLYQKLVQLQRNYGSVFEDLGIVDEAGVQIAYAGPYKLERARYGHEAWFREALRHEYTISDVFLGLRSSPHFIVSVKTVLQGETVLLRATINFEAFNSLVENLRIGASGFAFIVDREGNYQTRPHYDMRRTAASYEDFIEAGRKRNHGIYVGTLQDPESRKSLLYVAAPLKQEEWLLVYQQDRKEAFSDLNRTQIIAGVIIFVGALLIVLMNLIFFYRAVGRIAEADRAKEMMNRQVIETGKLASVGRLAAGIAHEINNPVAIMVEEAGWIDDLLQEGDFDRCENIDELKRALEQINKQGKRCKHITHKLLSFARKTDSRLQRIQINDMVEEVVSLYDKATYSRIAIQTHPEPGLPPIYGSQTEIQQVLLNLVNNAVYELEEEGGRIDITTRFEEGKILLRVEDDGPGIPEANLERIFDPFFTTKPVGKGTGLGLSICYGIIRRMKGDISVSSTVDVGTRFDIRLPPGGSAEADESEDER